MVLLLTDCTTKRLPEHHLMPAIPEKFVGDIVRFTLGYNEGVAFGITIGLGAYSRVGIVLLAALALAVVVWMHVRAPTSQTRHLVALGLIAGGALGNLLDRFVSPGGVVDFIDIGIRGHRFWTFNLAGIGIIRGAEPIPSARGRCSGLSLVTLFLAWHVRRVYRLRYRRSPE